jgi:nitroimidazol reductase NimA-like FMN-containing flavoprotein (pyridoxamine 5'-phosphate oxidase superfamily)
MIIQEMREADCYAVINRQFIARLASCAKDQPYVVPVQYALSDGLIYSFSMPGRKIDNMRENPKVCLQVDEIEDPRRWKSVLVEGRFRELGSSAERQQAWELLQQRSNWWEPGALKPTASDVIAGSSSHLFYTITIDRLSGRQTADG